MFDFRRERLERLIRDDPQFHLHRGELTSWSPAAETLRYLYGLLEPGMTTLETGCGQSTVVFAIAGTHHVSVLRDEGEAARVREYCHRMGLTNSVRFVVESSDRALPREDGTIPEPLDHVFIDGAHGFPAPILDWHFTAHRLRLGGTLAIDDCRMPSVRILVEFLDKEKEWEPLGVVQNTAFFRKIGALPELVAWGEQAINEGFQGY